MMNERPIAGQVMELTAKPTKIRIRVILILFFVLFVAYLDRVNIAVLVANNEFVTDLGIKDNGVAKGALMSMFLVTYAITNCLLSPLGNRFGPRNVMAWAIVFWIISCIWGGLALTFTSMIIARCILGLGEGMHWPMQMMLVRNWFPPNERARANSTWLVGLTAGTAVAMPFFVWIIGAYGWRESFYILAVIGLIPLFLLMYNVTDYPRNHRKIDKWELEYIEKGLHEEEKLSPVQRKADTPRSLWQQCQGFLCNPDYWLCVVFYFFSAATWFGLLTWIPSFLNQSLGFSWQSMGYWANLPYAVAAIACLLAGYFSDKIARKATFGVIHMLGAAAGIYGAAHATGQVEAALWLIVGVSSLMIGLPGHWAMIQKVVPPQSLATGAGLESALGSGAGAITPLLIGYSIDVTGGYTGGLMCLVVFCLIGMLAMIILWLRKV